MIDLSNLRAPGWQRVVSELSAPAPDDRAFMSKLLAAMVQVSGARQGVLYAIPPQAKAESPSDPIPDADPRPVLVFPLPPGQQAQSGTVGEHTVPDAVIERVSDAKAAARRAAASHQSQVFGLDADDLLYDPNHGKGYMLAVAIPGGTGNDPSTPLGAVLTLLIDQRSRQALQATIAMVEVLAGYVHSHAYSQQLKRARSAGASLDLAARLIASINHAETFKGATLQFVNDLCRQIAVDRVALGWIGVGKKIEPRMFSKVIALSDTENIDRRMAMIEKIEAAMDECLDQEQPVLYPPPPAEGPGGDVLLSQAIVHSHRELCASDANMKVATLPLRTDKRILGVVLVESTAAGPIDLNTIELLQASLDLVAPVLEIRRSDDRWLHQRAWDSTLRAGAWLVGPRHTLWKLAGAAVIVATLIAIFVTIPYRVSAPVELQPREPRTLSAPFDGKIAALGENVEAGKKVAKGDLLVQMDTERLKLEALEAQSVIIQATKEADEARKKGDLNGAQQADAKAAQGQARLDLANNRIADARLVSPLNGTIIAGDLKDKIDASVQIGQALFQVADLSDMVVIAKVDDRDIGFIREGMTGQISAKADPAREFDFVVDRIVPLSQAEEGKNAFMVRAKLTGESAPWFRPGMEGLAKFNAEEHSLAWIASRRIVDQLRLWLWW